MTRIYYFSGTGNGLALARGIAARLEKAGRIDRDGRFGGTELAPIGRGAPDPIPEGCRIGIVAPVYFLALAPVVADFVRALELPAGTETFGVVSMGLLPGNALADLAELMASRGAARFAGYAVRMPDNSVIFPSKEAEIPGILAASAGEMDRVAADIAAGGKGEPVKRRASDAVLGSLTGAWSYRVLGFGRMGADETCVGCGLCARACPVGNIAMVDGKPVWKDGCVSCMACAHRCPKKSVSYPRMNRGKFVPYVHPDIAG